jgi:hypothetical protein
MSDMPMMLVELESVSSSTCSSTSAVLEEVSSSKYSMYSSVSSPSLYMLARWYLYGVC